MANLDTRVTALEKMSGGTSDAVDVIFLLPMGLPGEPQPHYIRIEDMRGSNSWNRSPDEAEDAFFDRASNEIRRLRPGVAMLCVHEACHLDSSRL